MRARELGYRARAVKKMKDFRDDGAGRNARSGEIVFKYKFAVLPVANKSRCAAAE
jgi:hypothetical protein